MVQPKDPRKTCPGELVALYCLVTENPSCAPKEVHRIVEAIWFAVSAPDQNAARSSLNRRFSQLMAANPILFPRVLAWLTDNSTFRLFLQIGEYKSWRNLVVAINDMIHKGSRPHVAFGMDKNKGAPPLWGFTAAEDAAAYAQHLQLNEGMNVTKARDVAAELFTTSRRDIERAKNIPHHMNYTKRKMRTKKAAKKWAELMLKKHDITL